MSNPTPAAILAAATRTDWDRQFLNRPQILSWVLGELATAPFDPNTKTLLDYVKERMALAEQLKNRAAAQEQAQAQRAAAAAPAARVPAQPVQASASTPSVQQPVAVPPPKPTFSYSPPQPVRTFAHVPPAATPSAPSGAHSNPYTIIDDDEDEELPGSPKDEGAMEFDLNDFVDTSTTFSRSPSPLPVPASMSIQPSPSTSVSQTQAPPPAPSTSFFPFFQQPQPQPQQQPSTSNNLNGGLNPAFLSLHPHQQAPQQQHQQQYYSQQYLSPSHTTISPQQLSQQNQHIPYFNASANAAYQANAQKRARSNVEVEIVVPGRSSNSPNAQVPKRQKTADSVTNGSMPPGGTSLPPPVRSPQPQTGSSSNSNGAVPIAVPAIPPVAATGPVSAAQALHDEAEQVWDSIEKEIKRHLHVANRAPNKSVRKLFDLLSSFVTEPEGASTRNIRDASVTKLKVPPRGRQLILDVIRDETNEDFDTVFVVDPRATVLVAAWVKDLALIAGGKGKEKQLDEEALKATARPAMEVLRKLPITLDVLTTLTGVGKHVIKIEGSNVFDEVTKDIAAQLAKKWYRMASAQGPSPAPKKRAETSKAAVAKVKEEDDRKKRRLSPAPASTSAQPAKPIVTKPPVASTSTSAPPKPVVNGTRPIGTRPVGKALPAFARRKPAPAPVKPVPPPPPPAPAPVVDFNPFATALQDMVRQKEEANGGMSIGAQLNMLNDAIGSTGGSMVPRPGKKQKKSVRWETDDNLEKIKYVEKLVYGDEFGNETTSSDYFNTTGESIGDREAEGVALSTVTEEMEWEEPRLVDTCLTPEALEIIAVYPHAELMADRKPERTVQEEREQNILAVTYFDDADIPPTPNEPAAVANEVPLPDDRVTQMKLSWDLQKDDTVQMAIAAAQTRPYDKANIWNSSSTGTNNVPVPPASSYQPQSQPQAAPSLPTQDLSALLAKLSEGNLSNLAPMKQQQPVHQYHSTYNNWQ